ncbi:hypothetical protein [Paracoccus marcusii]|uniref:hypothetical protein n=1 Tax=Paracoccus marcusii TaxID=59779 RepID=UPI0024931052|nr:hypothetical protein [Paracoccus marcusii]
MNHFQWVDYIKSVGGLSDGEDEMRLAINGAKNFCYDYLRDNDLPRHHEIAEGILYIAAFMVSCAKNNDYEILNLYLDSRDYGPIFSKEAKKNTGSLAVILNDAAMIKPDVLKRIVTGAGLRFKVDPTGTGKRVMPDKQNSR